MVSLLKKRHSAYSRVKSSLVYKDIVRVDDNYKEFETLIKENKAHIDFINKIGDIEKPKDKKVYD